MKEGWYKKLRNGKLNVEFVGTKLFYPETCKEVLEYSKDVKNRKINKGRLKEYTDAMFKGVFKDTGCVVWLNKNDKLIDGQHRFLSVVQSNVPKTFLVLKLLSDDTALESIFDRNQGRSLSQILEEPTPYCNAIEFFHRIICRDNIRTTPYEADLLREAYKKKNVDRLVHSMSEKNFHSKKMSIQRFARCAFITACFLGYENTAEIWDDFIRQNTSNPVSNMIWLIIDEAVRKNKSTVLPQDEEREFYYKTLLCLKEKRSKKFLLTDKIKEEMDDFMRPMFSDIFGIKYV